jgi:hypothetical protein
MNLSSQSKRRNVGLCSIYKFGKQSANLNAEHEAMQREIIDTYLGLCVMTGAGAMMF